MAMRRAGHDPATSLPYDRAAAVASPRRHQHSEGNSMAKRPDAPTGTVQLWTGSDLVYFDGHDLVINRPHGPIKGVTTYPVNQIAGIQITKPALSLHVFRVLVAGETTPRGRQGMLELTKDPFVVQFNRKHLAEAEAVAQAVRDAQAALRQPAAAPAPQPPAQDRLSQLERLAALRSSGALTEDEFQREKARVLAGPQDAPPAW